MPIATNSETAPPSASFAEVPQGADWSLDAVISNLALHNEVPNAIALPATVHAFADSAKSGPFIEFYCPLIIRINFKTNTVCESGTANQLSQ
jgi:hypothetical protein